MQGSEGTEAQVPRPAGRLVGSCDVRLWSLSQAERWRRLLERAGIADFSPAEAPLPSHGSVVLARADYVLDDGSVRALVARRGCLLAELRTFDYQAPGFYRRVGYEEYHVVEGWPRGHRRHFFRKRLGED